MKQWNCSRPQAPGILDLRGSPLPLLSLPGKLGHLSIRVPYSKLKKKKKIINDKLFFVAFLRREHITIICSSMVQLLIPISHFLLMTSWQLFLLRDVFFPPSPTRSEVSTQPGNEQALPPPMSCPWARHPGPRVRNESRKISWRLPKVTDGNRENARNDCRKQISLSLLVSHNNNSYLGHIRHFTSRSS